MPETHPHSLTPTPTKRDLLMECARELFAKEGFHATGVDRILDRAGVAKMTLYRHYASKDALALAFLERRFAVFSRRWQSAVEALAIAFNRPEPHAAPPRVRGPRRSAFRPDS